jgi:hypothetical protein
MDSRKHIKPQRITAQDLAEAARLGVERALAARQSALTELTPEQVEQVSGGLTPLKGAVIKPPVVGVIIKPPTIGVVIKPPVIVGFLPVPFPQDPTA